MDSCVFPPCGMAVRRRAVGGMQTLDALEVERLRTEAVKNPMGIDVEKPMFSWRMDAGDERGVKQTAYEITVFSDAACTEQVWSSGRVASDRQIDVAYEGGKLQPSTRYYWTVTVWDNKGGESTSTEEAYFETGLMGGGWNGARWIQATDTPLASSEEGIHHYSVEADFEVDNISTGVIFAASEDQSHYYMWQINFETGYARLRPHVYRGDQQFATCLEEIDLRPLIDLQQHQTYHLRIEVDGHTAYTYIERLKSRGLLNNTPQKKRSLTVAGQSKSFKTVPLVGEITAGKPIFAVENLEGYFPLPADFSGGEGFALRVSGESMINAGIYDKDIIIVNRQDSADNGDIVVALIGDEATVKRFYKRDGKFILHPENDTMQDMMFDEISVLGVVKGLMRKF